MCLIVKNDYSKKPIPVVMCEKMLLKRTFAYGAQPMYETPFQYKAVPRSGVLIPERPLFGGRAVRDAAWRGDKQGVIFSGLIHAFPTGKRKVSHMYSNIHDAVAFGVEYTGTDDIDLAARAVYIPVCDVYHTDYEKEEFMKFCKSRACSPKIDAEDQKYIMDFIYGQED